MFFGLATVYSATYDANNRAFSQILNMAVGLTVMWSVAQIPPQKLMRFAVPLYVLGIVLLVLVFFFGIKVNGARRWLSIGITRIQPSEILKIAMPLMLAWYFHKYEAVLKLRHYLIAGMLLIRINAINIAKLSHQEPMLPIFELLFISVVVGTVVSFNVYVPAFSPSNFSRPSSPVVNSVAPDSSLENVQPVPPLTSQPSGPWTLKPAPDSRPITCMTVP